MTVLLEFEQRAVSSGALPEHGLCRQPALKCDVVVSNHPDFTDVMEKLKARTVRTNPFIDPAGCRSYAEEARVHLDKRLESEKLPKK
ncbi:MAG: hypothetical protein V4631_03730 [Pseudomonadota bacterium]